MGVNWISWSITVTVVVPLLQIQGVVSITTLTVTGVEGQTLSFGRNYTLDCQGSVKYFYRVDNHVRHLIVANQCNKLFTNGRFSLFDNSSEARVTVRLDRAAREDSGTYWYGVDVRSRPDDITVIQLTVVPATLLHPTTVQNISTVDSPAIQVNNPMFLTAVMCVAAMLFVCVFTLCLLLTVKHRRSGPSHNRQISADYETMMPSVQNEPGPSCTCPDCVELSAFSSPPPDACSNFRAKQRESTISIGMNEYADVSVLEHSCQYQCLDVSQIEEKVYQGLHGNGGVKDERAA